MKQAAAKTAEQVNLGVSLFMPSMEVREVETVIGKIPYVEAHQADQSAPIVIRRSLYIQYLLKGIAVGVRQYDAYNPIWVTFNRHAKKEKLKVKLYVRQVLPDLWLILARPDTEPKPPILLQNANFRRYGRTRVYLHALDKGDPIFTNDVKEAKRIKRSWQIFHPKEERGGRKCTITFLPAAKKYAISIEDEAG